MVFKNMDRGYWNSLLRASLIGIHMVVTTFVGLAVGYFLDAWLGSKPWLTMIFLLLGIVAGFKNMFQEVKAIQKYDDRNSRKG